MVKEDENENDKIYEKIIKYLDTNPDYLDFDPSNAPNMKWFITKLNLSENITSFNIIIYIHLIIHL